MEQWLQTIAEAEMSNDDIPMNNWEAKRIKLVSLIGLILGNEEYLSFADRHFKALVQVALNGDGTTRDLKERDALGYHTSGLKPLMVYGITLQQAKRASDLNPFTYKNSQGGSIRKSVDYVNPYARGEKIHKEWVNTTVELDKKRAEAGLEKYQPGTKFIPEDALEMYELAYFYDEEYLQLINIITGK
ncbi:MAG: alginate lyase family protein [Balneolaceae bacterium]|nr:alginate lyase family protein [Balneolaceae bacterium]